MKSLIGFELKKIAQKKIVWITMVIFLLFLVIMTCAAYLTASRYVDGKFLETKRDWYKTDRRNAEALSGKKIDSTLLKELADASQYVPEEEQEMESYEYLSSDEYQNKVRPYQRISYLAGTILNIQGESALYKNIANVTQEALYNARTKLVEDYWDIYRLSGAEKEYWEKEEAKLPEVFTYKYGGIYTQLIDMGGCYYICMFVTFFIAICMGSIFTDEHLRKTDQLILCTKHGQKQTYIAKMLAGCIFTCGITVLYLAVIIVCFLWLYGAGDFSAMVQVDFYPVYSGSLSVGQTAVIMIAILILSSVAVCIITMGLSELLNHSVGTMAIIIAVFNFGARLVQIPLSYKFISKAWNLLPINLLKADEGFTGDVRLWNIFGIKLQIWQIAPFIYIIAGIIFFIVGKKKYCKFQAGGR